MGGWKNLDTEQSIELGELDFDPEEEAQELLAMLDEFFDEEGDDNWQHQDL